MTDAFTEKNWTPPLLKVIDENSHLARLENDFFGTEKEQNPLDSFPRKASSEPPESKEKNTPRDQDNPFMSSFLVELIHSIKNTLVSIKKTSSLSADRFNDGEFRKVAQKSITEDIKEIDSVLDSLLNYFHINTPIIKSNTILNILEEVLEASEKQIQGKRIKIFKKMKRIFRRHLSMMNR